VFLPIGPSISTLRLMEIENRAVGKSIVIPKKTKTEGMYYLLCLNINSMKKGNRNVKTWNNF